MLVGAANPRHELVVGLVATAWATWHHDDLRLRCLGEAPPPDKLEGAGAGALRPGFRGDEGHLGARGPAENLIGADRVGRGQPVVERVGDLQGGSLSEVVPRGM
jgi:hypothetical protein